MNNNSIVDKEIREPEKKIFPGLRWLFLSMFLASASLLLLAWEIAGRQTYEKIRENETLQVRRELRFIRREGDPIRYVQGQLNGLFVHLSEEQVIDSRVIEAKIKENFASGLGFVKLYFIGNDDRLIPFSGLPAQNQTLVQRIGAALKNFEQSGDQKKLDRVKGFFDVFVGGITLADIVREKSALLRVTSGGRPSYFYWNLIFSPDGKFQCLMMAHFLDAEVRKEIGYLKLLQRAATGIGGSWSFGFHDGQKLVSYPTVKNKEMEDILLGMRKNNAVNVDGIDRTALFETVDSTKFIVAFNNGLAREYAVSNLLKNIAMMLLVLAFIRMFISAGGMGNAIWGATLQSRVVMMVLFLPILSIVLLGIRLTDLYRASLEEGLRKDMIGEVERLDDDFFHELNGLQNNYRQLAGRGAGDDNWRSFGDAAEQLLSQDHLQRVFILDKKGNIVFSYPSGKTSDEILGRILPPIARRIFYLHGGERDSWKSRMDGMLIDGLTRNISEIAGEGFAEMFKRLENLDVLNNFTLANTRFFVYSNFIGSDKERPYLMIIWHGSEAFAEKYLQRIVSEKKSSRKIQMMMMPENPVQPPFPIEFTKYSFPVMMRERVVRTGVRQSAVEDIAGESYRVEAMSLKSIPGYIMFAMAPIQSVTAIADYLLLLTGILAFSLFLSAWYVKRILLD